ncbi:MAG: glutamate--tRNA ligase [Deltaproteobacteria bacterium]|nr:glutamate--tRNA ligase [Deltaproteobacteria bacterium]
MQEIRTRFAPSPTGYLHIGGARTALFNYLFARQHKGAFILRIEDTDVARSTEESTTAILDAMNWLGLDYDEGPFFQSQRFALYKEHAYKLLKDDKAYKCFCTAEELEARRQEAFKQGKPPRYDGRCREAGDKDKPFAIRFKSPQIGKTIVKDHIKGAVAFENSEIDDLIILRSDSTPTYNLCVVVDDATMRITHVIRGDDHLNNTPKQIMMYEAFGYNIPEFAHVPMILGSDKTRLSKRHGATSVMAYKEMGYLPHALVNYLARLGWSHGDEEIFSMAELIEKFSLENVGKSSGVFNPEKLLWLNAHYIKNTKPEEIAKLLRPFLEAKGCKISDDEKPAMAVKTLQERSKTLVEMADGAEFYFKDEIVYDEKAVQKFLKPDIKDVLQKLIARLKGIELFLYSGIEKAFQNLVEETGLKLGSIAQPVRVALTGKTTSPGIFEVIEILGKEETVFSGANARFEPKTRKRWLDKTEHTILSM